MNVLNETGGNMDIADSDKYEIIVRNKVTGEDVSVVTLKNNTGFEQWEKIVASYMASMLNLSGSAKTKFLVFVLVQKDEKNRIFGSYDDLAKQADVSIGTVKCLMPKLIKEQIVKRIMNGVFMVDPKMIRPGQRYKGAVLFDIWEEGRR